MSQQPTTTELSLNLDEPVDQRPPLLLGDNSFRGITEAVCRPVEWVPPRGWYIFFGVSLALLGVLVLSTAYLFYMGTGIWGLNNPVGWGWAIVNFVFWVGIGHAGTLISAILFLFRQRWRTSINRFAEAMTIFAVMCALLFPTIHVGRVWVIYWALPYPNQMGIWPNFRSPLLWDVFAVSIYGSVSLLFWYMGLLPDLATLRDRAKSQLRRVIYGIFALGWRGSHRHWQHYERAYLILAAISTPLVLSVHSIVSFDFAVSQLPGWHTTIFPPYFVAGAIFSGFAMVVTLMTIARTVFGLEHIVTRRHFENMAKVMLLTGSIVGYAYAMEFFIAWYSGNPFERFVFLNRAFGPYAWAYWIMVTCNVIVPQTFWFKRLRRSLLWLFIASILVNIGMWFERFVITVTSLHRDFLPSSWDYYSPTFWDICALVGSFGLFFTMFSLFVRFLPQVAMAEVKAIVPAAHVHHATLHPAAPHAGPGAPAAPGAAPAGSLATPASLPQEA
ncbi:MAG: polysulfide reductase NrfD [Proteobacteria bacterium]|nr:polysulfide reductase NrfD [Pseudomonadota bacterium]